MRGDEPSTAVQPKPLLARAGGPCAAPQAAALGPGCCVEPIAATRKADSFRGEAEPAPPQFHTVRYLIPLNLL